MVFTERRKYQRVKLLEPLRGSADGKRVFVVDVSRSGIRLVHQDELPDVGNTIDVVFDWDGNRLSFTCRVVRTVLRRAPRASGDRPLFESGISIERASDVAQETLRSLIEAHVLRALDEQKANAKGIPATAAQSFQTGKTAELVRHELINRNWRSEKTTDPRQPINGFTISSDEDPASVQMLRETYETADNAGRQMIRKMAELSVSKVEGIPTRRYEP